MFLCLKKTPLPESCPLSDPELTTPVFALPSLLFLQPNPPFCGRCSLEDHQGLLRPSLSPWPCCPLSHSLHYFLPWFHLHQLLWSVISVPENIFQILILKSQFLLPLHVCHGALAWPQLSSNLSCLPSARRSTALLSSLFPLKASLKNISAFSLFLKKQILEKLPFLPSFLLPAPQFWLRYLFIRTWIIRKARWLTPTFLTTLTWPLIVNKLP